MGKLKEKFIRAKSSLKFNLIFYYMLIFTAFVSFFLVLSYLSLRDYNYNNLRANMLSQSIYASELYESYSSSYTLSDTVINERFEFLNNMDGQIQLLDNNAVILYDNSGSNEVGKTAINPDSMFPNGESYYFVNDAIDNEMNLYYPITINANQIGVIRSITSLSHVNEDINRRTGVFAIFSVLSLIIGFVSLYYFANKFLKPINKLTSLASKLSDGQYKTKSNMNYYGEIGELAKTMDELSDNIVEKEQLKNDFISSISHELRTPLTSIKGWALTLQDSSIDYETRVDGLSIIETEADRLSDMVEDLLDFSRFTSPSFSLNKTDFDLVHIVKNIVRQMKPRAVDKEIDLIFDYNESSLVIIADENRLKQVFINLIDNAIKFTPRGGSIVVSLNVNYDLGVVICEVIDSGIGISQEEIKLVTTKFYKGSSEGSRTGLGLSISEEIILKHNGKLEIFSVEGEGTTIHFEIPLVIGGDDEEN